MDNSAVIVIFLVILLVVVLGFFIMRALVQWYFGFDKMQENQEKIIKLLEVIARNSEKENQEINF